LELQLEQAGADPEGVLEATYGWYWAVDVLQAGGARVYLAHPLGAKGFRYRRVKNDVRDAADLADLLRMGPTVRGLDRPTEDARIAGAGALPRQAGRDPIRTKGPDGYTNLCQFTLEWDSPASLRRIGACSARCSSCLCMGLAPTNALNSRGRKDGPSSENPIA
jgi:hypothetical protein